jgi:hypothetical protein
VLADTTQLHGKITEMGQRIRQLEDALTIFQSGITSERHPLLRDELLVIKFPPDNSSTPDIEDPPGDNAGDSIDTSGILTIGDQGAKYYGPSGPSEVCPLSTQKETISLTNIFPGAIPGMA